MIEIFFQHLSIYVWDGNVKDEPKTCVVDANHGLCRKKFVKNKIDIYVCPDCGCIMADTGFDQTQYETNVYYTMRHKTAQSIEYEWGFRWRYILSQIVKTGGSSLLDVGAGNGYFVALASREFSFEASGLELSSEEVQFAKDILNVHLVREDIAQHRMSYDVVTCFNVLEHVLDPRLFITELVKRLKPGGFLVITTPNPGCIHRRLRGLKNWNMVIPPHHINLFTKASLNTLMARENLIPIDYQTLSTYVNFIRQFDSSNLILRRLFFNLLKMLNFGADHFLIVRK